MESFPCQEHRDRQTDGRAVFYSVVLIHDTILNEVQAEIKLYFTPRMISERNASKSSVSFLQVKSNTDYTY